MVEWMGVINTYKTFKELTEFKFRCLFYDSKFWSKTKKQNCGYSTNLWYRKQGDAYRLNNYKTITYNVVLLHLMIL